MIVRGYIYKLLALVLVVSYTLSIVGVAVFTCKHYHKSSIVAISDSMDACMCQSDNGACCESKHNPHCDTSSKTGLSAKSDCCTVAIAFLSTEHQSEQEKLSVKNIKLLLAQYSSILFQSVDLSSSLACVRHVACSSAHVDVPLTTPLIYQIACLRL